MKKSDEKNYYILFFIILAFILRLVNLNQSFWLDEAAQVIESARPFSSQFNLVADFHPPLYHVLLHFWMILSHTENWIRLLSVILGTFCIFLIAYLLPKKGNITRSILAAFLLAISPYHIWYSQEARPYMLFVFLTLLTSFFLLRKKWIFYFISVIFLIYSLYFWPFVLIGQGMWILLKERKSLNQWLYLTVFSFIFYIPWVPSFIGQIKTGTGGLFTGWTNVVSFEPFKAIALMFAKFIFGKGSIPNHLTYALILIPGLIFFLLGLIRRIREKNYDFCFIFSLSSFFSSFLVSFFIPILAPQRLLFLIPFFYLIAADGLLSPRKNITIICAFLIIFISLSGLLKYYLDPEVQREDWRDAVSFVENDNMVSGRVALFIFPDPFAPYLWYKTDKIEAHGIAPHFILSGQDLVRMVPFVKQKQRVYLFQYLTGLTDPTEKTRTYLSTLGFKNTSIKNYPGVGFIYIYDRI